MEKRSVAASMAVERRATRKTMYKSTNVFLRMGLMSDPGSKAPKKSSHFVSHATKAFGLTQRFCPMGFHPGLDPGGAMSGDGKIGPGRYTYDGIPCPPRKEQMSIWKRQQASEEFSRNLGFRNATVLAYRTFMSKHLGPGSHEIAEYAEDQIPSNRDFGRQKKFFHFEDNTPAPGTYSADEKPISFSKAKTTLGRAQRFADEGKKWHLCPNRYEVSDPSSMKALSEKVVSLRGPYDPFTGPRGDSNIFNKLSVGASCSPDKTYKLKDHVDYVLHHSDNARHGKFLQTNRFPEKPTARMMLQDISLCYHDPKDPAPNKYNVKSDSIRKLPPAVYAFGITGTDQRSNLKWNSSPGPGRYHVGDLKCGSSGKKGTWVFTSKTGRTQYKAVTYNAF